MRQPTCGQGEESDDGLPSGTTVPSTVSRQTVRRPRASVRPHFFALLVSPGLTSTHKEE
jgi:hypothetical protein